MTGVLNSETGQCYEMTHKKLITLKMLIKLLYHCLCQMFKSIRPDKVILTHLNRWHTRICLTIQFYINVFIINVK
jgi:hypothetical protein